MRHPLCLLRTIWRSLLAGAWVMGHDYRTSKAKTPPNVHILECQVCGHVSMGWSWDSLEHLK